MCCNKSLNTEIYRLHERCPQVVYNDKNSTFNEPLEKHGSAYIHHQNLQKLAVEIFKVARGLSPEIINEIFQFREEITYELTERSHFHISLFIKFLVAQKFLSFLDRRYGHWCLMK